MSKMPDDIKTAINDYASGRADKTNVIKHAEFGYSLSLERIAELEKDWLKLTAHNFGLIRALEKLREGKLKEQDSINRFIDNILTRYKP